MEEEYYFVFCTNSSTATRAKPDQRTAQRSYRVRQVTSGRPLRFLEIAPKEQQRKDSGPADVIFDSPFLLMKDWIKDEIARYPSRGCQIIPAVFMDVAGNEHTDYWFTNCYEPLYVLDRERSEIVDQSAWLREMGAELDPEDDAEEEDLLVEVYRLNRNALVTIPQEERMLFLLGGVAGPYLVLHEQIVSRLQRAGATGIQFFRISDFVEGMQHR